MTDTLLINSILNVASERKATDVHLVAGNNPVIRAGGKIITLTEEKLLTPDVISNIAQSFLKPEELEKLSQEKEVVAVYTWADRSRFRARVFYQKGYLAISLRLVPPFIRSPKDLGVPTAIVQLLNQERGLIIITGPFGSGRTTTAAALLETLNQNRGLHIQTLEDPIEYLFANNQSIIEQRDVGQDTTTFIKGLEDIVDEDVDVVYVSAVHEEGLEIKILELAESGKLMIAVMDADSAVSAIDRFISNLPADKRAWGQDLLSDILLGVVAQRLLPRVGGGLSLAAEVLTTTPAVKSSIKENHLSQLQSIMQTSRDEGMVNLDKSLSELINVGVISKEEAAKAAMDPQIFK